jgi:hypothetical protein
MRSVGSMSSATNSIAGSTPWVSKKRRVSVLKKVLLNSWSSRSATSSA